MIIVIASIAGVISHNMIRRTALYLLLCFGMSGLLPAQKAAAPTQRYFRLICLVHLTGTGKAGDPIMPEYVAQGRAIATAAENGNGPAPAGGPALGTMTSRDTASSALSGASRPGFIAWSMQFTDDKRMAIIHVVAADHDAFNQILADKRPDVRVFEIGKDSKERIETELRKYKKDFSLQNFEVFAQ